METTEKPKPMFFVALRTDGSGAGKASCVAYHKQVVREFFREYAFHEIRHVDGDEMKRLMTM